MSAFDRGDGPDGLFAQMMATEGDTIRLETQRDHLAAARSVPEATISQEAFDELMEGIRMWFGTRLLRHQIRNTMGAHNVAVEIKVNTAALPLETGGEPPRVTKLSVIDGRYRLDALGGGQ